MPDYISSRQPGERNRSSTCYTSNGEEPLDSIAHQDFRMSGKINVLEYEDRLAFKNEGTFIPETIEAALESGYKPPCYRNPCFRAR